MHWLDRFQARQVAWAQIPASAQHLEGDLGRRQIELEADTLGHADGSNAPRLGDPDHRPHRAVRPCTKGRKQKTRKISEGKPRRGARTKEKASKKTRRRKNQTKNGDEL